MMRVSSFGLHTDESLGVKWLIQNSTPYNAVGLRPLDCPFQIQSHMTKCPHDFQMERCSPSAAFEDKLDKFRNEPVMKLMSPVPYRGHKHIYVETTRHDVLATVSKLMFMRSPIVPTIHPITEVRPAKISSYLNTSNLSCIIVKVDNSEQRYMIRKMIEATLEVKGLLIFVGPDTELYGYEHMVPKVQISQGLTDLLNTTDDVRAQLKIWGQLQLREYMKRAE